MFDQKDNLITSQIASSLLVQQMIEPEKLKGKNDYENKTEDNGNNGRWEKSEHLRFLANEHTNTVTCTKISEKIRKKIFSKKL